MFEMHKYTLRSDMNNWRLNFFNFDDFSELF